MPTGSLKVSSLWRNNCVDNTRNFITGQSGPVSSFSLTKWRPSRIKTFSSVSRGRIEADRLVRCIQEFTARCLHIQKPILTYDAHKEVCWERIDLCLNKFTIYKFEFKHQVNMMNVALLIQTACKLHLEPPETGVQLIQTLNSKIKKLFCVPQESLRRVNCIKEFSLTLEKHP